MDAGVLPVKRLDQAKKRLADTFDAASRAEIATALFHDALELCRSVGFLRWWVVSDDGSVLAEARRAGLETVPDPGEGLNRALQEAIATATVGGATSVTIVPTDVPLAYHGDLQDVLDTGATSDVVVVPSHQDGGTNALYLSPPDVIEPRFGPHSMAVHMARAEALALRCSILELPRLSLDIDTIEHVDAFLERHERGAARTVEVLRRLRSR